MARLVPNNFNNVSPKFVMKFAVGVKAQAQVQCRFWAMGTCTNPNCKFFHGPVDRTLCQPGLCCLLTCPLPQMHEERDVSLVIAICIMMTQHICLNAFDH